MHFIVAFIFLCTATKLAAGKDFVKIKCKDENVGLIGQQTILECNLVLSAEVSDASIQVFYWKRNQEETVVFYRLGTKTVTPGFEFAEPSLNSKNFNVSLLINNTTVEDGGDYFYFVKTERGESEGKTSLKVKAEYSPTTIRSIPEKFIPGEESKLICESGGGYPEGVLRWFDMDDKEWTASAKMEVRQSENGLFQLSSEFPLLRGSTYHMYTCAVFNANGLKESEILFNLLLFPEPPYDEVENTVMKIAAPIIVIGSLAVGLLMVLLLRRRRAQYYHHEVPNGEFNVEEDHQKKMDV